MPTDPGVQWNRALTTTGPFRALSASSVAGVVHGTPIPQVLATRVNSSLSKAPSTASWAGYGSGMGRRCRSADKAKVSASLEGNTASYDLAEMALAVASTNPSRSTEGGGTWCSWEMEREAASSPRTSAVTQPTSQPALASARLVTRAPRLFHPVATIKTRIQSRPRPVSLWDPTRQPALALPLIAGSCRSTSSHTSNYQVEPSYKNVA